MRTVTPYAVITLSLFTLDDETGVVIGSEGKLPRDPVVYVKLLQQIAASLQHHAENLALSHRLPK